jgi:hypothetical protein
VVKDMDGYLNLISSRFQNGEKINYKHWEYDLEF